MAREHARVLTRIWRDRDFRARTPAAQRAYVLLLTQRDVNYAGVLPLAVARWARASEHTAAEDVELAVKELEDHRFVVIDRDTDEVLIRSFIRNDGLIDQPKVLRVAVREALATESETLRIVLGEELRRVEVPAGKRGYDGLEEAIERAASVLGPPVDQPVRPPVGRPVYRDAGAPVAGDTANPSGDPLSSRATAPVGAGAVAGATLVGGWVGGRAVETDPAGAGPPEDLNDETGEPEPTVVPPRSARPPERCPQHLDEPTDRACRRCGAAREAAVEFDRQRAAAIRRCQMCDPEESLLEVGRRIPVSPRTRCDHRTDQAVQVAAAKDEPA